MNKITFTIIAMIALGICLISANPVPSSNPNPNPNPNPPLIIGDASSDPAYNKTAGEIHLIALDTELVAEDPSPAQVANSTKKNDEIILLAADHNGTVTTILETLPTKQTLEPVSKNVSSTTQHPKGSNSASSIVLVNGCLMSAFLTLATAIVTKSIQV